LIDADGDGKITEDDLKATMGNLGKLERNMAMYSCLILIPRVFIFSGQTPSNQLLQTLLTPPSGSSGSGTQPRSINFAQFLTLFGQKLLELDTEQEILDAFACFDEDDDGLIEVPKNRNRGMDQDGVSDRSGEPAGLRGWLKEYGDRMSDKEVSRLSI
jgi:myosin regulatory light chain 12